MDATTTTCDVCGSEFEPKFRYQLREENGRYLKVCSTRCQQELLRGSGADEELECEVCNKHFRLEYPFQVVALEGARHYYCSTGCRRAGSAGVAGRASTRPPAAAGAATSRGLVGRGGALSSRGGQGPRRIAVFNHKGGTGKTTTAVNLAAGFAEAGMRVLLIDLDGQGNVGASLGIRGAKSLYHVLVHGLPVAEAVVPVRSNLDVITSDETLAAAELHLAHQPNRDRVLRDRFASNGALLAEYDVVVLDCAPALSLMNQNALVFADSVLVPVGCDYLSLVGVRQVLKTMKNVKRLLRHDVKLLGVVPTFYDRRNKISREALEALREHFGERCFEPIRVNTKIREAPSKKMTIFEHAPQSNGAEDYLRLVARIAGRRPALDAASSESVAEPEATTAPARVASAYRAPVAPPPLPAELISRTPVAPGERPTLR